MLKQFWKDNPSYYKYINIHKNNSKILASFSMYEREYE